MKKLTLKFSFLLITSQLFVGCLIGLEQRRWFVSTIPFDEKRWKINDAEMRWEVRPGMARNLINNNALIGKSCSEVSDLLNMDYENSNCDKSVGKFELKQFYSGIIGIDPSAVEYLKIYYDENKLVKKAEIEIYRTGERRN